MTEEEAMEMHGAVGDSWSTVVHYSYYSYFLTFGYLAVVHYSSPLLLLLLAHKKAVVHYSHYSHFPLK